MNDKKSELVSFLEDTTKKRKYSLDKKTLQEERTECWVHSQFRRQEGTQDPNAQENNLQWPNKKAVRNKRARELQIHKEHQVAVEIREKVKKELRESKEKYIIETCGKHTESSDMIDIDPYNRGGRTLGERYWARLLLSSDDHQPPKPKRSLLDLPVPATPPTPFFKPLIPSSPNVSKPKPPTINLSKPIVTPQLPSNTNTAPYSIDEDLAARSHSYHYPYPYPGNENENENDLAETENENPDENQTIIPQPWLDPTIKPRYIRRFLSHTPSPEN